MAYSVLVDLTKLKDLYTGLGQVALAFGKALSNLRDNSLEFNFLLPKNCEFNFGPKTCREYVSLKRRYFPWACKKYDLWHALHQDSSYFPGNRETSYVLTINDLNFLEEKSPGKAVKRTERLQRKLNMASGVTVISQYVEKVVKNNLTVPDVPFRTIYYGVEDGPGEMAPRPKFLPKGDFLFTIGVIKEKKNFMVLLDFIAALPEYNLIIAGNKADSYARSMQARIEDLGLQDRVVLPGKITDGEKEWLFDHCQAFVFPSKLEGFGLPVIEAMKIGKPVFLSKYSSLPEIGREYAFYWEDFDPVYMRRIFLEKMEEFSRDSRLAERMRIYGADFTWLKCVNSYVDLYKQILGKS